MSEKAAEFWTRRTAAVATLLVAAFLVALVLEGRPAWCNTGPALWAAAWSKCTSQSILDPYSFTHLLHGIIFYWLLRPLANRVSLSWRLVLALTIEAGWEILENSPWIIERYRQDTAAFDYTGDSVLNSLGDIASALVGGDAAQAVAAGVAGASGGGDALFGTVPLPRPNSYATSNATDNQMTSHVEYADLKGARTPRIGVGIASRVSDARSDGGVVAAADPSAGASTSGAEAPPNIGAAELAACWSCAILATTRLPPIKAAPATSAASAPRK